MVFLKKYFVNPAKRQNFEDASGQIFSLILRPCHTLPVIRFFSQKSSLFFSPPSLTPPPPGLAKDHTFSEYVFRTLPLACCISNQTISLKFVYSIQLHHWSGCTLTLKSKRAFEGTCPSASMLVTLFGADLNRARHTQGKTRLKAADFKKYYIQYLRFETLLRPVIGQLG